MVTVPTTGNTDRPRSSGYAAHIDGLLVRTVNVAGQGIQVESAQAQAQQVNTSESPEEFTSDTGKTFALSDASGGEGLLLRHRRQRGDADSTRFWDSRGIKVERSSAGAPGHLCLLNDTEQIATGGANAAPMAGMGGDLFVGNGTNVTKIDTPEGTPSTSSEAVGAGAVVGLAVLGDRLYAAATSAMRVRTAGTWGATVASLAATGIWEAQDRLLVAVGAALHEWPDVTSATTTVLRTLPSGQTWVGVTDGPDAIYAAASNGYVYAFAADDTGALALIGQTLFQSETPTAVGASQGLVFVGTNQGGTGRVWAMTSNQGELSGAVMREWSTGYPRSIVADRENVYMVVDDGSDVHSTWRYDVVSGGMFRWWDFDVVSSKDCRSAVILDGDFYASFGPGVEVHRIASTLVDSGYLMTPMADFFSAESKAWVGASLSVGEIPTGGEVRLYYTTEPDALSDPDSPEWRLVAQTDSIREQHNIPITGVESRQLAGMFRIYADITLTDCPAVRSVAFRALLAATDLLITLPVSVSDWVEQPFKKPIRVPGLGAAMYAALRAKERRNVYVEVFRPAERVRGQVESVTTPVPQLAHRGSSTLVSVVTIRGRQTVAPGSSITVGPMGSVVFGAAPLGGVS